MVTGVRPQVGHVIEQGVIVLTIPSTFRSVEHFQGDFIHELKRLYLDLRRNEDVRYHSCIVDIQTNIVIIELLLSLFELYQAMEHDGSRKLLCTNYPRNRIGLLTSMSLHILEGFSLAPNKIEALAMIRQIE